MPKMILAETYFPLHTNTQTVEEIEEAIRLHKIQLNDPYFRKRERHRDFFYLGLAICYYRRAFFYSDFDREDVRLAVHFAHQAESFFTKVVSLSAWEKIQEVLGHAYMAKADGPRAEHYELVIPYLENTLKSSLARDDPKYQAEIHFLLMLASACRLSGTPSEKEEKIEEHFVKALELYPDKQDTKWIEYVSYMKSVAKLGPVRSVFDVIREPQLDAFPQILQEMLIFEGGKVTSGIEHMPMFNILGQMFYILDSWIEEAGQSLPSENQMASLKKEIHNFNFSALVEHFELLPREKLAGIKESMERLIQESIDLTESFESIDLRAGGEIAIATLYLCSAVFNFNPGEVEENLNKSRFHFERLWNYLVQFLRRPLLTVSQGRVFGTHLYFGYEKWQEAERIYRDTLNALDENYKATLGMRGKEVVLLGVSGQKVSLPLNQAYVLAKLNRAEEAVVLLEKWRGRQLNERLNRADSQLAHVDDEDIGAYQRCWGVIRNLETRQRAAGEYEYLSLANQLNQIRNELDAVINRIRSYLPEFLSQPTFADVQQASAPGRPLAYLLVTQKGGLTLLVQETGEVKSLWSDTFTIGDVEAIAEEWLPTSGIAESENKNHNKAIAILHRMLDEIGQHLIAPLIKELKAIEAKRICLIPCGALALFPLHAAPVVGEGALIDSFEVSYAPSAKALFNARQRIEQLNANPHTNTLKLVGIGDPTSDLENAVPEVTSIVNLWRSKQTSASAETLLQDSATKEALNAVLRDATHLHFACHGKFDAAEPLEAALVLANGQRLTLREILDDGRYRLFSAMRLVVLSACKTALINLEDWPEEVVGLPTGFLGAGVPGVVATLWSVNDLSTSLFMVRFYHNLIAKKMSSALALKKAQKWLREATWKRISQFSAGFPEMSQHIGTRDAQFEHLQINVDKDHPFANPYYWAGFVFVGSD